MTEKIETVAYEVKGDQGGSMLSVYNDLEDMEVESELVRRQDVLKVIKERIGWLNYRTGNNPVRVEELRNLKVQLEKQEGGADE